MMNVEWDAFDLTKSAKQLNWCSYSSLGSVINHNTMESFRTFDKVIIQGKSLLNSQCFDFMQDMMVLNDVQ